MKSAVANPTTEPTRKEAFGNIKFLLKELTDKTVTVDDTILKGTL